MEQYAFNPEEVMAEHGQAFFAEHNPSQVAFPAYEAALRQRLQTGERVWGVRNVDDLSRTYNLYEGVRGVVAYIMFDYDENKYTLYVDNSDDDAQLSAKLEELTAHNPDPLYALGWAVNIAESYADRLLDQE